MQQQKGVSHVVDLQLTQGHPFVFFPFVRRFYAHMDEMIKWHTFLTLLWIDHLIDYQLSINHSLNYKYQDFIDYINWLYHILIIYNPNVYLAS